MLLKIVIEECSCCVQTLIRYKMQFPLMSVSRMILVNYDNHSGLLSVVYFPKHHSYHIIPWSRAVVYKLIIMQMGKKFPPGVEPEGSLHIHVSLPQPS